MKLAFSTNHDALMDKIIAFRTNGSVVHVELLFSDGSSFSSKIGEGTRFIPKLDISNNWDIVDIGTVDEDRLRDWCNQQVGKKYDILGCIDFFLDRKDHDLDQWFCSAVCTAALQTQGIFKFLVPTYTSPEELYVAAQARREVLSVL